MTVYDQQLRVITGKYTAQNVLVFSATGTSVTYSTGITHSWSVGDEIYVTGLSIAGYNGIFTVTAVPTATTVRVANTTTGTNTTYGLIVSNNQYDNTLIDTLRITGGRTAVTESVTPMLASVDIIDYDNDTYFVDNFNLNHVLIVETYDTYTSSWKPLFTGTITDIRVTVDTWASGEGYYRYSLEAASVMSRLSYHNQAYSGSDALVNAGNAAYLWIVETLNGSPDYGSSMYWYGNVATDTVTMHKRTNGTYNDWDVIDSASRSARGNFHDRPNGRIYYASYASSASPSFYPITMDRITAPGLSASKSITDVYNLCKVNSTNTSITSGSAADATSRTAFGRRQGDRETELQTQTEVDNQAADFLKIRKSPKLRAMSIVIDLANTNLDDEDRSTLYDTRTNSPYSFDLDYRLGGGGDSYTNNWSWEFSRGMARITINPCEATDLHPL